MRDVGSLLSDYDITFSLLRTVRFGDMLVYFEGVLWHLYIKGSSVFSTLPLIQLLERWAASTDCMGRRV
jgi:hypothetical protein